MPGTNGIEVTRRILEAGPQSEVGILMLTMFEDDDSVLAAMRAGVRGYVLKGADGAETLRAIRAVARGEAIFGPSIARRSTSPHPDKKPWRHASLPGADGAGARYPGPDRPRLHQHRHRRSPIPQSENGA